MVVLFSAFFASFVISTNSRNMLLVNTTSGMLQGYSMHRDSNNVSLNIDAWRGIPYAMSPVNELRWKSSILYKPEADTIIPCMKFGNQCMQPDGTGDEDCLFLNIYRNSDINYATAPTLLPVLFYVHGGSLMEGSGNEDMLALVDGSRLNKQDILIVQINYRLNIFGFLTSVELSEVNKQTTGKYSSGNYGFSDQLLALQWVHDNIEKFGGDPNSVTIMGQSSGGTSVFALLSMPASKGLYHGAISLSGSPNITMSLEQSMGQNEPIIFRTTCKSESNTTYPLASLSTSASSQAMGVVNCMKNLSSQFLVKLIPEAWSTPGMWDLPSDPTGHHFCGLAIVDGDLIPTPFSDALRMNSVDVPLMIGNMGYEPDAWPERDVSHYSLQEWQSLLKYHFKDWKNGSDIADVIYQLYENEAFENPQKALDAFVTDYGITCASYYLAECAYSSASEANSHAQRRISPMYVFINEWSMENSFSWSYEEGYTVAYAYHTLDLVALTSNWIELADGMYNPTAQDQRMSQLIQKVVFEFIATHQSTIMAPITMGGNYPEEDWTFVFKPKNSEMKLNYKTEICSSLKNVDIYGSKFWWVN